MAQFILYAAFFMALMVGAYAYFFSEQKAVDPMKFVMEDSGYNAYEDRIIKKSQRFNMVTDKGLMKVHAEMDNLATQQKRFLNSLQEQQLVLDHSVKDATDILWQVQQRSAAEGKNIGQLQSLALEMQDEQRLLVDQGHDLLLLNDELTKNRQLINNEADLSAINNQSSLESLQEQYSILKDQAVSLFDNVTQHNQEVHDQMNKVRDQISALTNNAVDNSQERTQELIENERQNAENQQSIMKQRQADQEQQRQDQQNR